MNETQWIKIALNSRANLRKGQSVDDIIKAGRDEGCSKGDCIKLLTDIGNINLLKAKELVHGSSVWSDTKAAGDAVQDRMEKTVIQDES